VVEKATISLQSSHRDQPARSGKRRTGHLKHEARLLEQLGDGLKLRKKIRDERFLNLIWKLLRAGYFDLREARHDSLAGTPQGGLASPILANVYLHELDEKVEEMRQQVERGGKRKKKNLLYKKLSERKLRLVKKGATRTKAFRELVRQMRSIPAVEVNDPNFIRLKYLRYADDWLVGICGPRKLAEQVKEE
jgi:hypothetical protein